MALTAFNGKAALTDNAPNGDIHSPETPAEYFMETSLNPLLIYPASKKVPNLTDFVSGINGTGKNISALPIILLEPPNG